MAKISIVIFSLSLFYHQVMSQFLNRPLEPPRNLIPQQLQPPLAYPIAESYNSLLPISPSAPTSTTIITDCSPSTCKNLANTLQLMIVSNLLQNTQGGSDLALQLAAPLINELFTSQSLSCGCANPFASAPPSFVSPSVVSPSIYPPNVLSPNLIASLANAVAVNGPGILNYL